MNREQRRHPKAQGPSIDINAPDLPLNQTAQHQLDDLYPAYHFMTITNPETQSTVLVGTTKSIGLAPLYERYAVTDPDALEAYASIIVDRLGRAYDLDRWRKLGSGLVYIQGYWTPEGWRALKLKESLTKLNTLAKPKAGARA